MNELKQFLKNRRNLLSIIGLILMVAVIPIGVSLTNLRQIFFSQASGNYIALGDGNCVVHTASGDKALKCGTVPLVLLNPFATPTPAPPTTPPTPSPTPTPAPPTCSVNSNKTHVVNSNTKITYTYAYPASTKITKLTIPAQAGLKYSANGQSSAFGAPLVVDFGAAAASTVVFTVETDTACKVFNAPLTLTNSCGTDITSFESVGTAGGWGVSCATPAPTPAPVACQPPPGMGGRTTPAVKLPGGIRVIRYADTNSNTPTNILRGMNLTGFDNVRLDFDGHTYKANRNFDLRSTVHVCSPSSCQQQGAEGTKQVTLDIYLIDPSKGGTLFFDMEDSCRHLGDFAGSNSRATFGAGNPPAELPPP